MLMFDLDAALADILSSDLPAATPATPATQRADVAKVAGVAVAEPQPEMRRPIPARPPRPSAPAPSRQDAESFLYGTAQGDRPRTWTGRVVSLDEWRRLSDWERHGSTGQHFNALSGRWEEGDAQ